MNIEIVESYPIKTCLCDEECECIPEKYSMHVYIPDLCKGGMDIRGIHVVFRKEWKFFLPNKVNVDEETKKAVSFPCISFVDPDLQKDFMKSLTEKGTKFMQEKICEIQAKKKVKQIKKKPKINKVVGKK